jgi:hypothetical protein
LFKEFVYQTRESWSRARGVVAKAEHLEKGTELAKAQCSTIRLKLLKIGALIRITVRKVWISLAGGYPHVELFRQIHEKLCAVPVRH